MNSEEISPPPEIFRGLPCEYLKGIVREGESLTIYLDVSRLFSSTERLMLREISESAEPL